MSVSSRPPADLPQRLADLKHALRQAGERVFALDAAATVGQLADAAKLLDDVNRRARALTRTTVTGCDTHPHGPLDPEPQPGWSDCLLCNGRRRIAEKADSIPARRTW